MSAVEDRFWAKVIKLGPDECWPWTAGKNADGYGRFRLNGRTENAHRAAYLMFVGPVPDGRLVDHTCHNNSGCIMGRTCPHRACCNPAHLEPVTNKVNSTRGNNGRHNAIKTRCPKGHEYTEANTQIINSKTNGRERRCKTCAELSRLARLGRI